MKMILESSQTSQQTRPVRVQLVAWDLFKMLVTAILCGLAVSIAAAGVALMLAGNAEARVLRKEPVKDVATQPIAQSIDLAETDDNDLLPTPGALLLSDGCERVSLVAIERDWNVRIDGKRVKVRVMQTFQLPAEAVEMATFHVQLVKGARMQSLDAQSSTRDWSGYLLSAEEYERLTPAQYLHFSRTKMLTSHSVRGTVMTSPFLGLRSEDLFTIAYSYEMILDSAGGMSAFVLPLETAEEYNDHGLAAPAKGEGTFLAKKGNAYPTRGAVWVNWISHRPSRVFGLPVEVDLEMSNSRIEGFSWATREIHPGARFQIAWAL